jgi:hypothetical protein
MEKLPAMEVSQSAPTLFGPLPRSYVRHIFNGHPKFSRTSFGGNGWVYAKDLPAWMRKSLMTKLHWFKSCSSPVRDKMFKMCGSDEGFKALRGIFVSCEMRMNSVILADPDQPYTTFDKINVSLISNTLNDANYHKSLKGTIKRARKSIMMGEKASIPRNCSWLSPILTRVKGHVDTRVRELTLLQTRASGLPSEKQKELSIQDWIELVTSEPPQNLDLLSEISGL